jgi:cellulose synthase/poly-beta-1,6-N-acetylglucosamine synthase-like glycosyltransferase
MMVTILCLALGLLLFHFAGYPLLVRVLAERRAATGLPAQSALPSVSLVIAAYNEERVLAAKIANCLALDYPAELLQIVVVSDGSTDRTHAIAETFAEQGVLALHDPPRRGKSAALNRAVATASGEIVLFSDANNDFNPQAVREMVRHFADAGVGGVCGRKSIRAAADREASTGDSLYWRYESTIKKAESDLGIMTTADGEIFAVRRELWQPIPAEVINDDAEITFALVAGGFRIVYEPAAVSIELASSELEEDFRVKVRMIAGGFQTIQRHWRELLPPRSAFAFAFLAHKLLRWLVPVLLLVVASASLVLVQTPLGAVLVVGQVAFYGIAALGWQARRRQALPSWQYVPMYFSLMNLAALLGLRRFLAGDGVTAIWQKAAR